MMIGEIWGLVRNGFWKRVAICSIIVLGATFYGFSSAPFLRLLWVLLSSVGIELFTLAYTQTYFENIKTLFAHRKCEKIPMPDEVKELLVRSKIKIKDLRIKEGLRNAYVFGRSIVLGKDLVDILDLNEILAIVAHELGHIKGRHNMWRFLFTLPVALHAYTRWYSLPPVIMYFATLAYLMVLMIPVNWLFEHRADQFAGKLVGNGNMKSALRKITTKERMNAPSETHPSVAKRIGLLDRMN